jgi:site-specific DNA recombinase
MRTEPAKKQVRCAIYTRKSVTEGLEQEFNSLDAQREAAEAFIKSQSSEGWVCLPQEYSDGGFSGGNIERPGVQRLLRDVQEGEIDCIVVYKVDRLSRSLLDFARIMGILEASNCSFVSVTQQFNTSHSMGRLTLNILLSFAQFEREIISERTRDKVVAARRKGKWTGGHPLLGYDIGKDKRLAVNRQEAERVRAIFDLYIRHEAPLPVVRECRSLGWTTKLWVNRRGERKGGLPLNKSRIHGIITNPLYMGKVKAGELILEGEHEAIIDEETFNRARAILDRNNRSSGTVVKNRHGALLKGLLFDAKTGFALGHSFTKKGGKLYRYYVNTQAAKEGWDSCTTTSLPAAEIENFVLERVRNVGRDPGLQREIIDEAARDHGDKAQRVERERQSVFREIERLGVEIREAAASGDGDRLRRLREQSASQEEKLNAILDEKRRLDTLRLSEDEVLAAMTDFDPLWEQLAPRERARLVELLVERILVDTEAGTVAITFRPSGIRTLTKEKIA